MSARKYATLIASVLFASLFYSALCATQDAIAHQSQNKSETETKGQVYSGPQCLGPFCLDRTITTRSLFTRLGASASRSSRFNPYCYESQGGKAFLYLDTPDSEPQEVVTVSLADFANCVHMPVKATDDDIHGWATVERIGLGSLETDVVKAYGSRYSKEKIVHGDERALVSMVRGYRRGDKPSDIGETIIRYHGTWDDLRTAEFCIRDGKVSCVYLSRNE
jgi:hypothetical protein